jgi:hypothetical protein
MNWMHCSWEFHDIPQNPILSKEIPLLLCILGGDAWKSNSMRSSLEIHRRAPTHGKTNSICWSLEIHGRWTPIAMKWLKDGAFVNKEKC